MYRNTGKHETPTHKALRYMRRQAPRGKAAVIGLVLLALLCLGGCKGARGGRLTLEAVRSLAAEKGEALTWGDFERYPGVETGSGLYILTYEIDENFRLMIGGIPDETPMYIYLISTEDAERRIDIRYDNIDDFIVNTRETSGVPNSPAAEEKSL